MTPNHTSDADVRESFGPVPERRDGRHMPVTAARARVRIPALVLLALWCVALVFLVNVVSVLLRQSRETADIATCVDNMRVLGAALEMYSQDWDDHLPPSAVWASVISNAKYLRPAKGQDPLHCPAASSRYGYAMNEAAGGIAQSSIPAPSELVLLYETDSSAMNAFGGQHDVARIRHAGLNFLFGDGSCYHVPGNGRRLDWTIDSTGNGSSTVH